MSGDPMLLRVPADTAQALASPALIAELSALLATARREYVAGLPAGSPEALSEGEPWSDHVARAVLDWLIGRCVVEAAPGAARSPGMALVGAERIRQIEEKGYDAAHDDKFATGELAHMTIWYADEEAGVMQWPWDDDWPGRGNRLTDMVRTASLAVAEVDRLLRAGWRA